MLIFCKISYAIGSTVFLSTLSCVTFLETTEVEKQRERQSSRRGAWVFAFNLYLRVHKIWKVKVPVVIKKEGSRNSRANKAQKIFEINAIMCLSHLKKEKKSSTRLCWGQGLVVSTPVFLTCLLYNVIYAIRQISIEFMSRYPWSLSALEKVLVRGTGPELTPDFKPEILLTE